MLTNEKLFKYCTHTHTTRTRQVLQAKKFKCSNQQSSALDNHQSVNVNPQMCKYISRTTFQKYFELLN